MHFLIALIILLSSPVKAVNLLFFAEDGVCNSTGQADILVCSNLPQYRCCQAPNKSFCKTSTLQHINGSTDHYVMAEGLCDKNGIYTSIRDFTGLSYCINIPVDESSDRCSSYWEPVTDQDGVSGEVDHNMDCQEPDKMVYHDGNAMRQIHLPDGTIWDAAKHYQEKNYRELASFPTWNGSKAVLDE